MTELKIDPKFRDLIPKLTDEEFAQLEKNILADGRVKEPIVVWNGTIIDGHHRYYIVQKHPEISYEIEEKDFKNEYAAMAWACANQLGRRNLSDKDRLYLIGEQYADEKLAYGGDRKSGAARFCPQLESQENEESRIHNEFLKTDGRTYDRIAEQHGVARSTVQRGEKFAKGVDIADQIVPGIKETILHGETNIPKKVIEDLSRVTPDKQRKAVIAISKNEIPEAKKILHPEPDPEPYNIDDMTEEIKAAAGELHSALNQTLVVMHSEVLADTKNRNKAKKCLQEIVNDVQEFITKISN